MQQVSQQHGVGLVEVMVAVLLLSVAVLGFSALQLRAVSATDESLVRTQALSVVRGLAESMRANPLQMSAYQTTINATNLETTIDSSCQELADSCSSEKIAIKEAKNAAVKLNEYEISMKMVACPGTAAFSEIKCIVAAWGDTLPTLASSANACANESGIYNSGSTCIIVEAY